MIISKYPCEAAFIIDNKGQLIAALDEDEAMCTKGFQLILSSDPESDFVIRKDQIGRLILEERNSNDYLS